MCVRQVEFEGESDDGSDSDVEAVDFDSMDASAQCQQLVEATQVCKNKRMNERTSVCAGASTV